MDDGSRDVAESISMTQMQSSQGIDIAIATPHFYANDESVESFLNRRSSAFEKLKTQLPDNSPSIKLGAEVRYYEGISQMSDLKKLRIEDTKILLLEMPMTRWTEYMIRELIQLSGKSGVQIVLAHVERYFKLQKQEVWQRIRENGILMQSNASFFFSFATRRKAISLLKKGYIHLLGSDCHNMESRPPKIDKAVNIIRKRLGDDFLGQINEYGFSLLAGTDN